MKPPLREGRKPSLQREQHENDFANGSTIDVPRNASERPLTSGMASKQFILTIAGHEPFRPFRYLTGMDDNDLERVAAEVLAKYGARAGQHIVDQIILAVRAHDLREAHRWDKIGVIVERLV